MNQQKIGAWTMGLGQLLLFAIAVFCFVDVSGLSGRGELLMPLSGYLTGIFTGVVMQFVGAAIPNMTFSAEI
jgi:Na+/serine symporter